MATPTAAAATSRRRFLRSALAVAGLAATGSLLEACAPAAPSPTAAPAKPTEAPKPAAPAAPAASPAPAAPAAATASPAAAPAATTAPAAAKPGITGTLKLGVLLPYTKVYAALGESITNGMQLYFDANGGAAGGRKVEMIKEDEEADPQVGLRKVRKLVEQDNVDLLTGVVSSAVALALRDYVEQAKMLFLISNAGANDLTRSKKSPYIFRTSFSNAQPNFPMGEWIYKNQAKKVMIAAADYAAGKEATGAFKETFTAAGGQIVAEIFPPFQNTDYAPFLGQIGERKPELVYTFFAGTDAVNFVKQFDEFGLKKDIKLAGGGFLVEQDVLPAQGRAALGVFSGLHYSILLDNPENKKFVADYKAKFNKDADVYAMQGFDTARVISDALKATNGDTGNKDALIKAIEGISFASPRGPFAFDPATHNPIQNIYAREVREVGGQLANAVLATFEKVKDPGT